MEARHIAPPAVMMMMLQPAAGMEIVRHNRNVGAITLTYFLGRGGLAPSHILA